MVTEKAKRKFPYTLRRCKRCGMPFILGPLDPNVFVCPFHALQMLKGNPHAKKAKPIKNPYSRMRRKLKKRKVRKP